MTTDPQTVAETVETSTTDASAAPAAGSDAVVAADAKIAEAKAEWAEKGRKLAFLKATGAETEAAALEKSMGKKPGESEEPEAPSDDQPATNDVGDETPLETGLTATEAAAKAKPDQVKGETSETRRAAMLARQALERDGWESEDIDAMKPERLLAAGEKIRARQAKQDAQGGKIAKALRDAKAAAAKPKTEPKAGKDEGAEPAATRTPLDDILDDLDNGGDGSPSEIDAEADEAPEPAASTPTISAEHQRERQELHLTRVLLAEREVLNDFPGLKDEVNKRAVVAEMLVLDPAKRFLRSVEESASVMRKAAFIVFGPELKNKQTRREQAAQARSVVAGQPDVESRPANNAKKATPDQVRKAAFESSTARDPSIADLKFKELLGRTPKRR